MEEVKERGKEASFHYTTKKCSVLFVLFANHISQEHENSLKMPQNHCQPFFQSYLQEDSSEILYNFINLAVTIWVKSLITDLTFRIWGCLVESFRTWPQGASSLWPLDQMNLSHSKLNMQMFGLATWCSSMPPWLHPVYARLLLALDQLPVTVSGCGFGFESS